MTMTRPALYRLQVTHNLTLVTLWTW